MIPYYIKKNTPELREKLKEIGYRICPCCLFKDNVWLNVFIYGDRKEIHGIGGAEDISVEAECARFVMDNPQSKECDEEEFIIKAKELYEKNNRNIARNS